MEKLKINPEKDLKELEQYGFKRKYRKILGIRFN